MNRLFCSIYVYIYIWALWDNCLIEVETRSKFVCVVPFCEQNWVLYGSLSSKLREKIASLEKLRVLRISFCAQGVQCRAKMDPQDVDRDILKSNWNSESTM